MRNKKLELLSIKVRRNSQHLQKEEIVIRTMVFVKSQLRDLKRLHLETKLRQRHLRFQLDDPSNYRIHWILGDQKLVMTIMIEATFSQSIIKNQKQPQIRLSPQKIKDE
jgi:hypothetical protein